MRTIVATGAAQLQAEVQHELLCRADLRLLVVRSVPELLQTLRQGAELCLLGRGLEGASVAAAARAVRCNQGTAQVPVILLAGPDLERSERRGDFDEVLELPAPPGALSLLVSRYLGVPLREAERFAVRVHVFSTAPAEGRAAPADGPPPTEYLGTSVDLSELGMMLKAWRALPVGELLRICFLLPGQERKIDALAQLVRIDARSYMPAIGLALQFAALSAADRAALRGYIQALQAGGSLRWHIVREGERLTIVLSGVLRPEVDLGPLRQLRGELDLRLRDVRLVSPDGIQCWLDLIRSLSRTSRIRLLECPIAFVRQANAIGNLPEHIEVVSFFAPYVCPRCGLDEACLLDVERDMPCLDGAVPHRMPVFPCSACGGTLVLDDVPDRYFACLGAGYRSRSR
ncbi:MAG: PilZ domain-containing protein [Myxococcales bacterium]|nr:PilZ domain-containing protein [Myxococcota bacterium]MDW8283139.1 PilZ domain-containing protein [Myxococcales bacterium]